MKPFLQLRRRSAFTLVEVLVALVLVAIILPVAMRGVSLATAAAGESKRKLEAASLAERKLAELVATGEWQGANLSGDCGPERPDYRWTAQTDEWVDPSLRQLTVRIEWTARGRQRDIALTTLVHGGRL